MSHIELNIETSGMVLEKGGKLRIFRTAGGMSAKGYPGSYEKEKDTKPQSKDSIPSRNFHQK